MSTDEIIAKVKAHPELWQQAHPFYRHRFVVAKTWLAIAEELDLDETVLRKRWKHLKDQHRKEVRRLEAKTIAASMWQHFKPLNFLLEEMKTTEEDKASNEEGTNSDSDDEPLVPKKRKVVVKKSIAPTIQKRQKLHSLITRSPDSGKLNFILNRLTAMEEVAAKVVTNDSVTNDPDHMFILSLLPIMKKLSTIQKLQLRGKINDWMLEIVTQNEMLGTF